MHERGLFSFVLVSLFLVSLLAVRTGGFEAREVREASVAQAVGIEKAGFERSVLEREFDSMLERVLREHAIEGILDAGLLREAVLFEIISFAREEEIIHNQNPKVDFYMKEKSIWFESAGSIFDEIEITRTRLRGCVSVFVYNPADAVYIIEFTYTGGIGRNMEFGAKIKGEGYEQRFNVPVGYRKSVVVGL